MGWRRKRNAGFEIQTSNGRSELVVVGDWSPAAADALQSGRVDRLVLNYARGFREPDIEFLRGSPISSLSIVDRTLLDLSPVYTLGDSLTDLHAITGDRQLDLQRLPRLRTLATDWRPVADTVRFATEIEELYLEGYGAYDLGPLTHLAELTSLRMKHYPNVKTLDGVDAFRSLRELRVVGARELADISALGRAALPVLTSLDFDTCRKIPDLEPLTYLQDLTYLNVANSDAFPTAGPLANLLDLDTLYLYESTNIIDGDLGPIAGLPRLRDFRMMNRRHYRPTVQSIKDGLTEAG